MKLTQDGTRLYVWRETGEQRARTESHFWHMLRNRMERSAKRDNVSKHWYKVRNPGALSAMPYALRLGRHAAQNLMVYDGDYAIRMPHTQFNKREPVTLTIARAHRPRCAPLND